MSVASLSATRRQKRDAEKRSPTTSEAPALRAWNGALSAFVWNSGKQVYSTSSAVIPRSSATLTPHQML